MKRRLLIVCILSITASFSIFAQTGYSNLEFIENKGQWDKQIHFKANITNGTFLLHKQGFTVVLRNAADMDRVRAFAHNHNAAINPKNNQAANTAVNGRKLLPNRNERLMVHSHAYRVNFVNANENIEIVPDKPLPTYNNYFIGNDPTKWASDCKIYQGITYKNIYPNIDLRYYTDKGTLKYDLIVHPGGDPEKIMMRYAGVDKLSIKANQLIAHTSVSDVKEFVPHSYQLNKINRSELDCRYVIEKNNTVRFKVSNYAKDATLIIDPTLVFSTFTGSTSDNWGYTATYDNAGNFYSGSIVLNDHTGSPNGFPVVPNPGAFLTGFQGGDGSEGSGLDYDIGIMKFNSTGSTIMYATYLGGSGDEQPHSLIADNAGNLVIAGRTSSTDYPTRPSGPGGTFGKGGGFDICITKLNANGTGLIGSKKIGGEGWDGVNIAPKYANNPVPMGKNSLRLNYGDDGRSEVILDAANNIYVASSTQSDSFPTVNPFQAKRGGRQDGVFIKTSPDLSVLLASSYLGGANDDAAFVLAINPTNGDVYVGGGTSSTNFPGTTNGPVLFSTNQGGIDGFVAVISGLGTALKKSSYFGTTGTEVIYGVQFDNRGFPYIMGTTTGTWPVVNAAWSQANGKQFISKLKPDLSAWVYSTVFGKGGSAPDISPTAFLVDRCENVYVSGWGGGIETEGSAVYDNATTSGLTTTSDAIKKNTDGADFYFFVLQKNASAQLYGSFFGQDNGALGDHVDGGTSRFDKQGIIYEAICANCFGPTGIFPTTPGVWARNNGTGTAGCNLAAVKIAFNFAGVAADVKAYINNEIDTSGCTNVTISFKDDIGNAKFYVWDYDTGNHALKRDTTSVPNIDHVYPVKGVYTVMLIAVDSNTCNVADTAYTTVKIGDIHAFLNPNAAVVGDCRDLNYQLLNLTTVTPNHPNPPFTDSAFLWDFGDGTTLITGAGNPPLHHYPSPGSYKVTLTLNDTVYCNSPESTTLMVNVAQFTRAAFTGPLDACIGVGVNFQNTSTSGQQFNWDFGDNSGSTDQNPSHIYADTGTYTVKLVVTDPTTCNGADSTQATVRVHTRPQAAFTDQPVPPETNKPTIFFNNSTGADHFKWIFGDGDSVLKRNMDTVVHQYEKTGTFQACLIAFNQFECSDTVCAPVETIINPLLDVPNAFTPGRFGQNSTIGVKGFGIASMDFRIYNRYGQLVFESNDKYNQWDGTYKGVPQPSGVFAYTLTAIFFTGAKETKKGDITLIR